MARKPKRLLTDSQERLLIALAEAAEGKGGHDPLGILDAGDGFMRIVFLRGRFKGPSAEILARHGFAETGYDLKRDAVTARITEAGRQMLNSMGD